MKSKPPLLEELLVSLSQKEISLFADFIKRSAIRKDLKNYWKSIHQSLEYSQDSKKPLITFDFQKQRSDTNKLLKQLEYFLSFKYLKENPTEREIIFSKAISNRDAHRNLTTSLNRIKKQYSASDINTVYLYELQSFAMTELLKLNVENKPRKRNPEYEAIMIVEKKRFLMKYLLLAISELSTSRVIRLKVEKTIPSEKNSWLLPLIAQIGNVDPVITLLFDWKTFLENPSNQKYEYIKERYWELCHKMDSTIRLNLFASLLNEATVCEIKSPRNYLADLFEIYSKGENMGIFSPQSIPPAMFKNYYSICLRLKQFDHARVLMEKYSNHLPQGYEEYADALWHFCTGNVHTAKERLSIVLKIDSDLFVDVFFSQGVRILDLQIACDIALNSGIESEFDHAISKAGAYINYLRRHTSINSEILHSSLSSAKLIKRLLTAQKIRDFERILNDLEIAKTDRPIWIMEKVNEMIRQELNKLSRRNSPPT